MNILLTGAFGNVGSSTLEELIGQAHQVRCFDLPTRANLAAAHRFSHMHGERMQVVWGDLRRPEQIAAAVCGQDVVVHLAFIIPKLSATGVESEARPDWAREINVGGTRNLIDAMKALPQPPRLLFSSSYHVFGRTQDQPPPRTVWDPVQPIEHYSHHKVECEHMVRVSGLEWTILRLSAALPFAIRLDPGMFDVPLDNRIEFVHSRDVALAIANAVSNPEVWRRILLIGGGPRCQYYYREIVQRVLDAAGVGMLPEDAFTKVPFPTDWVDSSESQRLLQYQRRDLGDYLREMKVALGYRRALARMAQPLARQMLLRQSPYYRKTAEAPPAAERVPVPAISLQSIELTPEVKALLVETANQLKGRARRLFMARAVKALGVGEGGMQRAERELGWPRNLILAGMQELERAG
jgi:UDP-glucose 4-epimerase